MVIVNISDNSRCPYVIVRRAGDESQDSCELNNKICPKQYGNECEVYNDWKSEDGNQ